MAMQEGARDQRPDHAADVLEAGEVALDVLGRDGDGQGQADDHGRMAQGEEEPDAERPLAPLHQVAGGVVDGRDVVGVEGVAQPEAVGQTAGAA